MEQVKYILCNEWASGLEISECTYEVFSKNQRY